MGVKRNLEDAGFLDNQNKITEDEAALYDRQIRLWGVECQQRLREASILAVGISGVAAEVIKNLALTGVKAITVLDDAEITSADYSAQFFISAFKVGNKRAESSLYILQELNRNVNIGYATGDIFSKPDTFFKEFTAMVASDCSVDELIKLNELCRKFKIQFYCVDTWGFYGYCFMDLQDHTCSITRPISEEGKKISKQPSKRIEMTKKYSLLGPTMMAKVGEGLNKRVNKVFILLHVVNHFRELFDRYPSANSREKDIEELIKLRTVVCQKLDYDEKKISDEMLKCVFGQLSPVCAAVGGILSNEIIKGISRNGLPVYNYFLFDGNESIGGVESILVE